MDITRCGLTEHECEFFRGKMHQALGQMFQDRPIKSPATFFAIWQDTREILEEELRTYTNYQTEDKLKELTQE